MRKVCAQLRIVEAEVFGTSGFPITSWMDPISGFGPTCPAEWEIWIELKDGGMRGKHGEIISRKAFEQRRPFARTIVILPDNERDDLGAILSQGDTGAQQSANTQKER